MVKILKYICRKCCDEINLEPCTLRIPKDPIHKIKDIEVGLTTCPLEGCNYIQGEWVKNGVYNAANWERVK